MLKNVVLNSSGIPKCNWKIDPGDVGDQTTCSPPAGFCAVPGNPNGKLRRYCAGHNNSLAEARSGDAEMEIQSFCTSGDLKAWKRPCRPGPTVAFGKVSLPLSDASTLGDPGMAGELTGNFYLNHVRGSKFLATWSIYSPFYWYRTYAVSLTSSGFTVPVPTFADLSVFMRSIVYPGLDRLVLKSFTLSGYNASSTNSTLFRVRTKSKRSHGRTKKVFKKPSISVSAY